MSTQFWCVFISVDLLVHLLVAVSLQVAVDEKFSEPLALIDLFKFRGIKTSNTSTYMGKDSFSPPVVVHIVPFQNTINSLWPKFGKFFPTK